MTSRLRQSAGLLSLLFVIPLPGMAWLCRGRTPSAYAPANLPFWEAQAPTPAPERLTYLLSFPDPSPVPEQCAALREADASAPAFAAGDWLAEASPWLAGEKGLRAKARAIAIRLLSRQDDAGYLGAPPRPRFPQERDANSHCRAVAGLIAYYRATGFTPAIYAAMRGGDWLQSQPDMAREAASIRPLTALYRETNEEKYLTRAMQAAQGKTRADGLSLCALFEATGNHRFLAQARLAWHRTPDPALEAALLRLSAAVPAVPPRLARQAPRPPRRRWPLAPEHPANTWRSEGRPS